MGISLVELVSTWFDIDTIFMTALGGGRKMICIQRSIISDCRKRTMSGRVIVINGRRRHSTPTSNIGIRGGG